jgi:NADH-quinone oxidoreductase subunit J
VYVGAIAVLFLFVVMMLNIKIIELDAIFWRYAVLGFSIILLFLLELFLILFNVEIYSEFENSFSIKTMFFDLDYKFLNPSTSAFFFIKNKDIFNQAINFNYTFSNTELLGWYVYTYGVYIFFLLGLVLLIAMVGSIVLVLNQNVNIRRQFIFKQILRELKSSVVLKK